MKGVPLERLQQIKPDEVRFETSSESKLEFQSLVQKDELEAYLIFTSGYSQSVDQLIEQGELTPLKDYKGALSVEKTLSLNPLVVNDCALTYCFQHRLSFASIPSLLWKGLIGIEDNRFLKHVGVDLRSILRALWHDLKVMRLEQGGSTITQQLSKNLFYSNEKKFSRKLKEFVVSLYLEYNYSKEEILEAYFNEIEWGSFEGIKIKGVYSASLFYFSKKPQELNAYEVSILISLLKGPYFYHPLRHPERLEQRTNVVFTRLKELKMFSQGELGWDKAKWKEWREKLELSNQKKLKRAFYLAHEEDSIDEPYSHYVFFVKAGDLLTKLKERYPELAITIKSVWFDLKKDKTFLSYYSSFERDLKEALENERHQVGSTLKPILYSIFLKDSSISLEDEISAEPFSLSLKSGNWSPREAHQNLDEYVTLREALLHSYNRPVIRLSDLYGWENLEKVLAPKIENLLTPLRQYPAQLLGALELSPKELLGLYLDFLRAECQKPPDIQSVLELLSDPTQTTVRRRVHPLMAQMKFFGKTGTSNQGLDNWFVSFDGRLASVTWVGVEQRRDKAGELSLYGSNSAFLLYQNYMLFRGQRFNAEWCRL